MELVLFKCAGVSLVGARALSVSIFGLTLLAIYRLLEMWGGTRRRIAPALTVLMLATSGFCFVFTRLAVLEPLLVLLTVLALIAATPKRAGLERHWGRLWDGGLAAEEFDLSLGFGAGCAAGPLCANEDDGRVSASGDRLDPAGRERNATKAVVRAGAGAAVSTALLWGGYY